MGQAFSTAQAPAPPGTEANATSQQPIHPQIEVGSTNRDRMFEERARLLFHLENRIINAIYEGNVEAVSNVLVELTPDIAPLILFRELTIVMFLYASPLSYAAYEGDTKLVKFLLEHHIKFCEENPQLQSKHEKNCFDALLMVIYEGKLEVIETLLENGIDVSGVCRDDGSTPLHQASGCTNAQADCVRLLLEKGADPNHKSHTKDTPLHAAVKRNRCEVVEVLLQHGAHVDARNSSNQSPLDIVKSEDVKAVLLEYFPPSLPCLAASAIVQNGIAYQGAVPSKVEKFIKIHEFH